MKEARILQEPQPQSIHALQLDDFSRFKEKVIMINTLKRLLEETDKRTLKALAKETGDGITGKHLRHVLESIVEQAIKRAAE